MNSHDYETIGKDNIIISMDIKIQNKQINVPREKPFSSLKT